jgi:ectoine hydroxylase-related dioxygenase (phytanoyl-CoA dioxygenase family)
MTAESIAMLDGGQIDRVSHEIGTLGFSVVEDVIDAGQVSRLRAALLRAIEADQKLWGHKPQKRYDLIHNLVVHEGVFLELLDNPVMHQVFAALLSPTCILYNYGSTFLLPGGSPGSAQIHVDSPRIIPNYHSGLIMTLALDDFTEGNGATRYLPGSQHRAEPPDEEDFKRHSVSVARPAGAAVFFNPRCYHRAMPNETKDIRCGVTVFAVRAYMKQRFDFPRMISPEAAASLSAKARQFLGFDARVPADMSEFYVAEDQRLYKANQG